MTRFRGELPYVNCYPQQLNQVFMNLLVNAAQAIEKQGEIRIITREAGSIVEIVVSDTGQGIDENNLSRIFDPFFTTKDVGQDLEKKIQERTLEILMKSKALEEANASLERSFVDTIRLLSSLVETLNPSLGNYLNIVAQLAKRMGQGLGLDKQKQEQIEIAGLLHDIGLLGLPKILLGKNMENMADFRTG